jgi:hypothetical protein
MVKWIGLLKLWFDDEIAFLIYVTPHFFFGSFAHGDVCESLGEFIRPFSICHGKNNFTLLVNKFHLLRHFAHRLPRHSHTRQSFGKIPNSIKLRRDDILAGFVYVAAFAEWRRN